MGSLTGLTQESLVALLLYDKENGARVRSLVPIDTYDGPYRRVVEKAVAYWDAYREPPGEHALDICRGLEGVDPGRAELVRRLFDSIQECREGLNAEYVLGQAAAFVREQRLRAGIIEAAGLVERGKVDDAEAAVQKALKGAIDLFYSGLIFNRMSLGDVLAEDVEALPTGIKLLDDRKLGPAVGELNLLIAPSGYGKSWWLLHLGRMALMDHKRVVYITLEMSERKVALRFIQAFCAVRKRRERLVRRVFRENDAGQFCGIDAEELRGVASLGDAGVEKKLRGKLERFGRRSPLVIRQFPTGSLTMRELIGYLDSLESQQKIRPDLLLVDYPDLMHVDRRQEYRIALGVIFQELRGLAVSRSMAVATVSQTNRRALGKRLITEKDVAEDYSKIATSDVAFSYNQTEKERGLGLARLHVMKARNEEKGLTVLLTQNYATGQFCVSSTRMVSAAYWAAVEAGGDAEE